MRLTCTEEAAIVGKHPSTVETARTVATHPVNHPGSDHLTREELTAVITAWWAKRRPGAKPRYTGPLLPIYTAYVHDGLSQSQVAAMIGVCSTSMHRLLWMIDTPPWVTIRDLRVLAAASRGEPVCYRTIILAEKGLIDDHCNVTEKGTETLALADRQAAASINGYAAE